MPSNLDTPTGSNPWVYPVTLTNDSHTVVFQTAGKYVDRNIRAEISVNSGSVSPIFAADNIDTYFNTGTSGSHSIAITPKATTSAGFIGTYTSSSALTGDAGYYTIKTGTGAANSSNVVLYETDGSAAGINVKAIVDTANVSTSEPSSGYYLAFTGSGSSKVTTAGWFATGALTASSTTKYFPITAASVTHSGGGISITTNYSDTPDVDITLTAQTTTGVALTNSEPSSGYYLTLTGASEALSGKTKATRAAYTETFTAGYLPAKASTNILTSSAVEPTVTVGAGSVGAITGTNTVSPTVTLNQADAANVTLGTTNSSGISIKAVGGGTATATASTNITTAGYIPSGADGITNSNIAATSNTTNVTKYITAVTIPSTKSLTVTNNGTVNLTTSGTANVTSTGTTVVTSNSTTTGTITIKAKTVAGDTATTDQDVVTSGLWKTNTVAAADTYYYGRTSAAATTITTSYANSGMSTYFTSQGSSSGASVTITPKYTATAGFTTAVATAANNGGTGYWKIKTVSGSIGGTAANGAATAVITNVDTVSTIAASSLSNKTAGVDYWEIKATATGTNGSYTPKYTVSTAGWISSTVTASSAATVTVTSDTTGQSLYIPKADFNVSANKVYCSSAGYVSVGSASSPVYTIGTGAISGVSSDPGSGYTANTTSVPSGGWLKLTAGYYPATKISLASLVPDASAVTGLSANYILSGHSAYNNDGTLINGSIQTYQGAYEVVTE